MLITGTAGFVLLFLIGYLLSHRFRTIANGFWSLYVLELLKFSWPYVIIYAVYDVINSGRLADTFRVILGH